VGGTHRPEPGVRPRDLGRLHVGDGGLDRPRSEVGHQVAGSVDLVHVDVRRRRRHAHGEPRHPVDQVEREPEAVVLAVRGRERGRRRGPVRPGQAGRSHPGRRAGAARRCGRGALRGRSGRRGGLGRFGGGTRRPARGGGLAGSGGLPGAPHPLGRGRGRGLRRGPGPGRRPAAGSAAALPSPTQGLPDLLDVRVERVRQTPQPVEQHVGGVVLGGAADQGGPPRREGRRLEVPGELAAGVPLLPGQRRPATGRTRVGPAVDDRGGACLLQALARPRLDRGATGHRPALALHLLVDPGAVEVAASLHAADGYPTRRGSSRGPVDPHGLPAPRSRRP